jgi:hypothetical protein
MPKQYTKNISDSKHEMLINTTYYISCTAHIHFLSKAVFALIF